MQIGIRASRSHWASNAQRVDLLEEKLTGVESSLSDLVTKTVDKAVEAMRHSLMEVVIEGQNMAMKTMGAELEALTGRLEGRVNRSHEYHETLINAMRNEQLKFQSEIKTTLTEIHTKPLPNQDRGKKV